MSGAKASSAPGAATHTRSTFSASATEAVMVSTTWRGRRTPGSRRASAGPPPGRSGSRRPSARSVGARSSTRAAPTTATSATATTPPAALSPSEPFRAEQEERIERDHGDDQHAVGQGPAQHQLDVEEPVPQDRDPDRDRERDAGQGQGDAVTTIGCRRTRSGPTQASISATGTLSPPIRATTAAARTSPEAPAQPGAHGEHGPEEQQDGEHQADDAEDVGDWLRQPRQRRVGAPVGLPERGRVAGRPHQERHDPGKPTSIHGASHATAGDRRAPGRR